MSLLSTGNIMHVDSLAMSTCTAGILLVMLESSTFCQKYKMSVTGPTKHHQFKACVHCQVAPSYFDASGELCAYRCQ